jgi:glucose/arabinose dehydrogenase
MMRGPGLRRWPTAPGAPGLWILLAIVVASVALGTPGPARAALTLDPVVTGLVSPVYVTNARDGTNRLFIVEQGGIIKVLQPGSTVPTVFLDITERVLSGGERGLLGLAFHPQFATNRRFFVNYTRNPDGATVIAEHTASSTNPNVATADRRRFLVVEQPFANHNGGMIAFGPDGFLYIGMGDGGSGNDPGNRAQNIEDLLGKMLRIDVDRKIKGQRYSSPPGNPFLNGPGRDEIFAVGFRNPFRFSFDRETGALYVGDVGQRNKEEVAIVRAGENHGWRIWEGLRCTGLDVPCVTEGFTFPVTQYGHLNGRCSVIGGYVYRGGQGTLPLGTYVFGDLCTGEVFRFHNGERRMGLVDPNLTIVSFGEDEAGELYLVSIGGTIYRFVDEPD